MQRPSPLYSPNPPPPCHAPPQPVSEGGVAQPYVAYDCMVGLEVVGAADGGGPGRGDAVQVHAVSCACLPASL